MVKKHKKFRFGPQVLIRLIIFFLIVIFSIRYLSSYTNPSSLDLPPIYNYLPENTKQKISSIPSLPAIISIQNKINQIKCEGSSFINNQIKEIKKMIIKKTADELIKNIDQK